VCTNDDILAAQRLAEFVEIDRVRFESVWLDGTGGSILVSLCLASSWFIPTGGKAPTERPYPMQSGQTTRKPNLRKCGIWYLQAMDRSGKP
jgi:hypothetical protein